MAAAGPRGGSSAYFYGREVLNFEALQFCSGKFRGLKVTGHLSYV